MNRTKNLRPAVFLDRDGTLIVEAGYPSRPEQVELLPGAAAAVRLLRQGGFTCVVVTNQSGVGRGFFSESDLRAVHEEMHRQLRNAGTEIDGLYYCTFAPRTPDKMAIEHPDRKPGPGMLLRAARELNLDLAASWMVGDSVSDVLAGRNAGCRGSLLVKTGHELTETLAILGGDTLVLDDLKAAAEWILAQSQMEIDN